MKRIIPLTVTSLLAVVACGPMLPDKPANEPSYVLEWAADSLSGGQTSPAAPTDSTGTLPTGDTIIPIPPQTDSTSGADPVVVDTTTVTVGGIEYKTAKFADGRWWMTENLRNIPEGAKFGEDIFYPCSDTTVGPDDTAEGIVRKGLLYSDNLAFGTAITAENINSLEGTQGICPEGWHIPTADEWMALVGKNNKSDLYPTVTTAAFYSDELDSGSIEKLESAGYRPVQCGYGKKGSSMGYLQSYQKITMSYYYGSTVYAMKTQSGKEYFQYFSLMLSGHNGKAVVATQSSSLSETPVAGAVRCIKNE